MALSDLLYRCPECGHDPTSGEGDRAWCEACGAKYERGPQDRMIQVTTGDGQDREALVDNLVKKIEIHGGPITRATKSDGSISFDADVLVSRRVAEDAVWHKGELRGFSETMGEPLPARLSVDADGVTVTGEGLDTERWNFLDLRALQTSSSSLQLSLPGDILVQFKFVEDSPRRWEDLMRRLVRDAYSRANRGFVLEFQPRIVTR